MSLIRDAQVTLQSWRAQHLAVAVVYRRAGQTDLPISAVMAQSTVTLDDGRMIAKTKLIDWLIEVSALPASQ